MWAWGRLGGASPPPLEEGLAVQPVHELQGQEGAPGVLPELVGPDDVVVGEAGGRLRLAAEALPHGRVIPVAGVELLQGHHPSQAGVAGAVETGHATAG